MTMDEFRAVTTDVPGDYELVIHIPEPKAVQSIRLRDNIFTVEGYDEDTSDGASRCYLLIPTEEVS